MKCTHLTMSRVLKLNRNEFQQLIDDKIISTDKESSDFCLCVQEYIDYLHQKNKQITDRKSNRQVCELDKKLSEQHIIDALDALDSTNNKSILSEIALPKTAIKELLK